MFCIHCGGENPDEARFCGHCGQPSRGSKDPAAGVTRLPGGKVLSGRYELVSVLGRGGMGQVWKAKDRTLDRDVAVKMLPPEIGLNPRAKEAMKNEAQLLLRLSHPNICRLYTYEEDGRACFLVMELVEGKSLEQELEAYPDRRMPLEKALPLFSQVAEALDYAHGQNPAVLHRDIKPANIMVDGEGRVKVLDFGIACEIRETMTRMTGKASAGTLLYMSPEQVKGQKLGPATDLYSLGVAMYESLAGNPPFHAGSIEYQIINETPDSLIERGAKISKVTEEAVLRGLAKEISSRPGTCGEFVRLVREADKALVKVELPQGSVSVAPNPSVIVPAVQVQATLPKTREIDLGGGVSLELVLIPAGTFMMGSPLTEEGRDQNEIEHEVTISNRFYMGKYPVTQVQWQVLMGRNPSHFKGAQLPVEQVSYNDALNFLTKICEKTGLPFRLPTEAQWEYACRAGTTTPFHFGNALNGNEANCNGKHPYRSDESGVYLEKTSVVGGYLSNKWGLHDMHGNVWEWCSDWHYEYPFYRSTDYQGPDKGKDRVLRGGSWSNFSKYCRAAFRGRNDPGIRFNNVGFRVLLSLNS